MDLFPPPSDQGIAVRVLPIILQPALAKGELVLGRLPALPMRAVAR
jgi:hypothetical protein